MADKTVIDWTANTAELDRANELIAGMSERMTWIIYLTLHRQGLRVDAAEHEIAKRAPRKAT